MNYLAYLSENPFILVIAFIFAMIVTVLSLLTTNR